MMNEKTTGNRILIVDDETSILDVLQKSLVRKGFACDTESDGLRAVHRVKTNQYSLVILDVNMPYMNGTEMLRYLRKIDAHVPVVMISGVESIDLVRQTLRDGAYDYLVKPLNMAEFEMTVQRALEHGAIKRKLSRYQKSLEQQVAERTNELANALERINHTYNETILALGSALETRDIETQEHGVRVARFSHYMASTLGIRDPQQLRDIQLGAYLHDIGKIGVPDAILRKPDSLSAEEWEVMKRHPEIGKDIIEGIEFLGSAKSIVYSHHERFDGSGYPLGLLGNDIPIEARIFAVADALDAMITDRPYRKAMSIAEARGSLIGESGMQFDPDVSNALASIDEETLLSCLDEAEIRVDFAFALQDLPY